MKLTNKQQKEIDLIKYFIPENMKSIGISDENIKKYFELVEEGKHKHETAHHTLKPISETTGYGALLHGLVRRDINIAMYIQDFKEYEHTLIEIWVKDQDFPPEMAEHIIKKLS